MKGLTVLYLSVLALAHSLAAQVTVCDSAAVYEPCEIAIQMSDAELAEHPNPYLSVELRAEFRSPKGGRTMVMPGFWDGGKTLRLRFSPDFEGRWDFRLISNLPSLDKKVFAFQATPPNSLGFVKIFNTRYFRYDAPDTGHYWMGDTCYRFATIDAQAFRSLVDQRAEQKFNHLRGLVLGWDETAASVLADPDRPDPAHFQEVDRRIAYLNSRGITFDLLLAGDRNQLVELLPRRRQRARYVRYLVARYAAYNITWQGVQEFEEYDEGRRLLKEVMTLVKELDPYSHPRSTHTLATSSPLAADGWMTYIVHQSSDAALAAIDYETHLMPVVNAELGYENSGAGASHPHHVSSDEFRKRLWRMAVRGSYPTFGNTATYGGREFQVDASAADSLGARYMTHLFDFFAQTRFFDLQPYYRVEGGGALSMQIMPFPRETPIGIEYIVYLEEPGPVEILLPKDGYDVSWFNPIDGTWLDQKKKFKGERFQTAPPDTSHDWVLYVRREGKKESFNQRFFLESRGVKAKEIETSPGELPYGIQFPDQQRLTAGQAYEFNATLKKSTAAAKRMLWLWVAEVSGSGFAPRILGAEQFGKFMVPANLTANYPGTLSIRLMGLDGAGRLFEDFRAFSLDRPEQKGE